MTQEGRAESISAVTLHVTAMDRSCGFYERLGFERLYGGPDAAFSSYAVGAGYLNLQLVDTTVPRGWGRTILHVDDVDAMYRRALDAGTAPDFEPRDAPWGERYFHLADPDGHELSFARPI